MRVLRWGGGTWAHPAQEKFETNNKQLERILNNLEKKLEEKRRYFPRFYFLSNDDLLDILGRRCPPPLFREVTYP